MNLFSITFHLFIHIPKYVLAGANILARNCSQKRAIIKSDRFVHIGICSNLSMDEVRSTHSRPFEFGNVECLPKRFSFSSGNVEFGCLVPSVADAIHSNKTWAKLSWYDNWFSLARC